MNYDFLRKTMKLHISRSYIPNYIYLTYIPCITFLAAMLSDQNIRIIHVPVYFIPVSTFFIKFTFSSFFSHPRAVYDTRNYSRISQQSTINFKASVMLKVVVIPRCIMMRTAGLFIDNGKGSLQDVGG